MAYKPILSSADLPHAGDKTEDLNFDIKSSQEKATQHERAKDVAAFANAAGGVILLGANENKATNTLTGWNPYKQKSDAALEQKNYTEAVKNLCFPLPSFDVQILEQAPGAFVVAVNVWPHSLPPVGVKVPTDSGVCGKNWDAWAFFIRANNVNKPLTHEEASVLNLPTIRRIVILLDTMPEAARKRVTIYYFKQQHIEGRPASMRITASLTSVQAETNVAVFERPGIPSLTNENLGNGLLHLPLSEIESAWPLPDGGWAVLVRGLIIMDGSGNHYIPRAH